MPPAYEAPLAVTVQLLNIKVGPQFRIPPPWSALPFVIVIPLMAALPVPDRSKTRLELLPLTVKFVAPGPLIVRLLVITSSPLVSVMVPVTAKSIVSPGGEIGRASCRERV